MDKYEASREDPFPPRKDSFIFSDEVFSGSDTAEWAGSDSDAEMGEVDAVREVVEEVDKVGGGARVSCAVLNTSEEEGVVEAVVAVGAERMGAGHRRWKERWKAEDGEVEEEEAMECGGEVEGEEEEDVEGACICYACIRQGCGVKESGGMCATGLELERRIEVIEQEEGKGGGGVMRLMLRHNIYGGFTFFKSRVDFSEKRAEQETKAVSADCLSMHEPDEVLLVDPVGLRWEEEEYSRLQYYGFSTWTRWKQQVGAFSLFPSFRSFFILNLPWQKKLGSLRHFSRFEDHLLSFF